MKMIGDKEFKAEVLKYKGLAVIDFWAEWCSPCRMFGPVFNEVSEEMGDHVKFLKMNIDEAKETAAELNVMSIPTVMLFRDGKKSGENIGAMNKKNLMDLIRKHMDDEK